MVPVLATSLEQLLAPHHMRAHIRLHPRLTGDIALKTGCIGVARCSTVTTTFEDRPPCGDAGCAVTGPSRAGCSMHPLIH
jgi:hypothetical protein